VVFYDTGHFALETHAVAIGQEILASSKGISEAAHYPADL
jgi:hypothetical protein